MSHTFMVCVPTLQMKKDSRNSLYRVTKGLQDRMWREATHSKVF